MKKTFLSLIFSLALVATAPAQGLVDIRFSGSTATVDIPATVAGVSHTIQGADVIINSSTVDTEYTYHVSGSSNNGSLTINGQYKLTLQLDGLSLTNSHGGAAIDVECGKRIAVELTDGTVSTLSDIATGGQKAAFYFKGHPEFRGGGTLNVTGRLKHAIAAKEYIELKPSLGTINILSAAGDGIHCGRGLQDPEKNYFLMRGGSVNIWNAADEGIDADDYGAVRILDGGVSITVGDGATGIKADSTLSVMGGLLNTSVAGRDATGLLSRYATTISGGRLDLSVEGDGSKGIRTKNNTDADATVRDGGRLTISGGRLKVTASGGTIVDEATGDTDRCMAVSTDADLRQTAGDVAISVQGLEAASHNVKGAEHHLGGTWQLSRQPWVADARSSHYDMTLFVRLVVDGQPVSDYTQLAVGAFLGDQCTGCADLSAAPDYAVLRVRNSSQLATPVSFRLYDYAAATEQALVPAQPVSFAADAVVGTPSEPFVLSVTTGSEGIADVRATSSADSPCYDLQGRRLAPSATRPGVYVSNHRKLIRTPRH